MTRTKILGCVALGAIVLLLCSPVVAQERAAQLTEVSGTVSITRAADGSVDEATQMGPRVRNGSVFPHDKVATGAGSSAKIVFADGTELRVEESTSLAISEMDVAALAAAGNRGQTTGRTIQVFAGKVFADVVPDQGIVTQFETPSGVAAVKGTTLAIEVKAEK